MKEIHVERVFQFRDSVLSRGALRQWVHLDVTAYVDERVSYLGFRVEVLLQGHYGCLDLEPASWLLFLFLACRHCGVDYGISIFCPLSSPSLTPSHPSALVSEDTALVWDSSRVRGHSFSVGGHSFSVGGHSSGVGGHSSRQ